LRRFEFVGGSSAKFWEAGVEGSSFVVTFGRMGTSGQRKAKAFATEAEAQRECDKKIAEKLREGYQEVGAGAPAAAPAEPAAPAGPVWPARRAGGQPSPDQVSEALGALQTLSASLEKRSWVRARAVGRAQRALKPLGSLSPEANAAFTSALEGVLARVVSPRGRLPLADALSLLARLDAGFFARALGLWAGGAAGAGSAAATLNWLGGQAVALGDNEAALRVGLLVADRRRHPSGWVRRRDALWPHLGEHLRQQGSSAEAWSGALDAKGDASLGATLSRLKSGA
jgi:predicted DNA-binding WGR domain protein